MIFGYERILLLLVLRCRFLLASQNLDALELTFARPRTSILSEIQQCKVIWLRSVVIIFKLWKFGSRY